MSDFPVDPKRISRRNALQLLGAGLAAAAIAACQPTTTPPANTPGTTTGGTTPTTGTTGATTPAAGSTPAAANTPAPAAQTQAKGQFNGGWPYTAPPAGHFNLFAAGTVAVGGVYHDLVQLPLGMYLWKEKQWVKLLATDWKFNPPDNFTVTLRQGVKWNDGKDFTAQDVVSSAILARVRNNPVWRYVNKVEAKDNYTVSFTMNRPSTVIERYVIRNLRIYQDAVWNQFVKQANDIYAAGKDNTSDDIKNLSKAIDEFRPKNFESNGPYMYDPASVTEAQLTMVRNESSYIKTAQFAKIVIYNGETEAVTPIVLSKQGDYMTHGFPVATDQAFQAQGIRVTRGPTLGGGALVWNYARHKVLSDKRVRQAMAYAVNKETHATVVYAKSGKPPKYMAGVSAEILEGQGWLSAADLQKLNNYDYNLQKANDLMTAAGCKKGADGIWADPEGKPMSYELIAVQEFLDNMASAQDVADQMTKFGIKLTLRAVPMAQLPNDVNAGKFDFAIRGWGAGDPHPHFSLVASILNYTTWTLNQNVLASIPLKMQTDSMGEINFEELTIQSAEGLDQDKQKALVLKACQAFNELVPTLPLYERYGNNPTLEGVRVKWPPETDTLMQNPPYTDSFVTLGILEGKIVPV